MGAATKLKLTRTAIDRLPYTTEGQKLYRFDEPAGLALRVGTRSKVFVYQSDAGGQSRRVTIGPYSKDAAHGYDPEGARARALELAAGVARGKGLTPNPRRTLKQAFEHYLQDRKTLAEKTRTYNRHLLERYVEDWLDKPLASITNAMVVAKHAEIAKRIEEKPRYENATYKGETTANNVMRVLRVVWNHASADDENLPANPVRRLSATNSWFPRNRKTDYVPTERLSDFWDALQLVPNLVHSRYVAFLLFTGMRRNEAAQLTWDEYDAVEGVITLAPARTKNRKGVRLYLSAQAQDILNAMQKTPLYIFPADSEAGHIKEPRWALDWIAKKTGIDVSVHGLRRTFVTIASSCPVSPMNLAQLVGHAATTITESYAMPDATALREAARVIGNRIEALALENKRREAMALLA